jgi:D-alanyl-D-alanine carboxypeptidase/D-alanyl-D-alanine-endopeptidase (penicillin-binding protein 4)
MGRMPAALAALSPGRAAGVFVTPSFPRVRRVARALLIASTVASSAVAAPARIGPTDVDAALQRAKVPAEAMTAWVQEVGSARPRLAWQGDVPMNPASLLKIVTTDAALELLGPAWTWSTPVWLQGPIEAGVLQGDLVVKGSGDPKLVLERVWLLLRRVQQLGVREIRGDIVLDRSAFAVPEQAPGDFDNEPLRPYNARPDALLLNYRSLLVTFTPDAARGVARVSLEPPLAGVRVDATVPLATGPCEDWRTGLRADFADATRIRLAGSFAAACGEKVWAVAFVDPRTYNERLLAGLWQEMGGRLGGTVREGSAPTTPTSFELVSPTLPEVVRDINKYSNNVMAEQLFLTLGLADRGLGTPENARAAVRRWLDERFGRATAGFVMENGSGLSRDSRISSRLLALLLLDAWGRPMMPELMSSFPVAGVDGTLRRGRATPGRAHLKTGSLRDVIGVAGYVLGASGRRYVVVAIVNHANANAARPALDALVQWAASDGETAPSALGR